MCSQRNTEAVSLVPNLTCVTPPPANTLIAGRQRPRSQPSPRPSPPGGCGSQEPTKAGPLWNFLRVRVVEEFGAPVSLRVGQRRAPAVSDIAAV
jgi:hypothetical protein